MKKLFLSLAAIVALFATSCVTDATDTLVRGDQCTVTFTVAPDAFGTRAAINDGTKATQLSYAVYKSNWEFLFEGSATMSGLSATIPVQLVKNNTYNFVFWAQSPEARYYTVDFKAAGGPLVTVDYTGAQANDDNRDAFFGRLENYLVTGPISATVTLTRPFAQVNFATNDTELAEKAGFNVANATTTVTIEAFSTLNLANGTVDGLKTVTFAPTTNPTETLTVKGSDIEWDWLAMNYILWGADEASLSKCEMTIATNNMTSITVEVPAAPAKRNWRTNLVGSLLIEQGNIEIIVDQKFEGEYVDGIFVSNGVYHINNANGLSALAAEVEKDNNGLQGKTIILDGDIDLAATRATANFTPIGTYEKPFRGTFDGNGYTIKNLNYVSEGFDSYVGFFGYAKNATIKNVVFENVNVKVTGAEGGDHIAAVAGVLCSDNVGSAGAKKSYVENVTVKGNIYIDSNVEATGSSRVAVVIGGNDDSDVVLKNVHVIGNEGSYVKANSYAGGIVGQTNRRASFENCTSNIDVTATRFFAGGIAGAPGNEVSFVNCHSTGDVTVTAGRSGAAHDHYRVGGIAGGWDDNVYFPLILTNCSYTGKLSGTNADGTVAEKFDYMGYVGRGYSVKNDSTVTIDGISFVQTDKGVYSVTNAEGEAMEEVANGLWKSGSKYSVTNAEGLATLNSILTANKIGAGASIELLADIDFTGKTWTPVRSHIDWKNTVNSFNGNGHTISNLTINGQAMFTIFANGADVEVKNVTFDNAIVNCANGINAAIIVGQTYNNLLLENVDVKNSAISGQYKVAPLVGTVYNEGASTITATLKNCNVENTTVKATVYDYFTTGLVSFVYTGDNDKIEFENCTVSNVRLYAPNAYEYHAAIYADSSANMHNEAEGVTVTNVTFENI